ncbi:MAG: NAD(P)-binding domain-containing protein, partial [Planctomycetota bacterium]
MIRRYLLWLHCQCPAGTVEKLPEVAADGSTGVHGLYVVGDLTGVPLLKFSADSGARAVQRIAAEADFVKRTQREDILDVAIIGAGVSGLAAALEARRLGLSFEVFEATEPLSTIVNFPRGKPIFTYPSEMTPAGELRFHEQSAVKEGLLEDLEQQTLGAGIRVTLARVERVRRGGKMFDVFLAGREAVQAWRIVVAIGRSGNFRRLGVPGEEHEHVFNRLHDPRDFCGKRVCIIGGGDSALETAIALARCGAEITLSYRKPEFSRPKPGNLEQLEQLLEDPSARVGVEHPVSARVTTAAGDWLGEARKPGSIQLMMSSKVQEIRRNEVRVLDAEGREQGVAAEAVFRMIGREAPLEFFRRSGVRIRGEWRLSAWAGLLFFLAFCVFLYHWKGDYGIPIKAWFKERHWFPFNLGDPADPGSLLGTLALSMQSPSFYYTLAYTLCIVLFGIRRIRRRRTPYVKRQTLTLMAIQILPLFLLPYVLLPWAGHNGCFDAGAGRWIGDQLFPATEWDPQGREYWRSVGFILAWPLLIWNVFTHEPLWAWLAISLVQTFVLIPLLVLRFGKGAYCGWLCSCGALAETMGDAHRQKMPHGPRWNRLNMVGQLFLLFAVVLLLLRILGWLLPGPNWIHGLYMALAFGKDQSWGTRSFPLDFLNYAWFVDLVFAGIFGVAFYFWFSGRVWCRFACPLAALMHIYARFSQFRILSEKKKCISCNVCTSVCHQGIDV